MYTPIRHIPSIFFKQDPIHLTYFLTKRCNAKCPYCFYLKNTDHSVEKNAELSVEEIKKISRSFKKLLWLAFSGGEVFLRRDLEEISSIFYRNNKPVYMLYPTNGLMPDLIKKTIESILEVCKKSVIVVKLTINDLYGAHDRLQATPRSFEMTMKTLSLLSPLMHRYPNFELGINTVFCAQNQDKMPHIIDFVDTLPVTSHTVSVIRGELQNPEYQQIDYDKYMQTTQLLAEKLRAKRTPHYSFTGGRLKSAQDIVQRRLIHQTALQQTRQIPCYAGKSNLVMSENGAIYPCETLTDCMGNIRDYNLDIRQLLASQSSQTIKKTIAKGGCHCTHECNFITNIFLNPKLLPRVGKEFIKL